MARYLLFEECIDSEISFPRLAPSETEGAVSLEVRRGLPPGDGNWKGTIPGICRFALSPDTIWVQPDPQARDGSVATTILGPIMAIWLRAHRGLLCLHASSVEADGSAVVFAGDSGAGKSTLARAFVDDGCQVLADDLVAIDTTTMAVLPAYPELRLWPASMSEFDDRYPSRKVSNTLDKRALQMSSSFSTRCHPLSHVFLVEKGPRLTIGRCGTAAAVRGLLANTWEYQLLPGSAEQAGQHLGHLAALLESVTVWRIERTEDLSELPSLVDAVKDAIASTA